MSEPTVRYRATFAPPEQLNRTQRTVLGVDYSGGLFPRYTRTFEHRENAEFWLQQAHIMLGFLDLKKLEQITTMEVTDAG